jgi:hypothetical protein
MRYLLPLAIFLFSLNIYAEQKISESSIKLNDFQKRNHSLGLKFKKVNMSDAKMYKVSNVGSNAKITYASTSLADIEMTGLELSYLYRWNHFGNWRTTTEVLFTTSLDEPELPTYEAANFRFEMYGTYAEAIVAQRIGYLWELKGSQIELYSSLGIGYSSFKLVENWKEVDGNSGDSVDLKSYAHQISLKASVGVDYRWSPEWGMSFNMQYTNFKVDSYHTDLYGWWTGSKVTGENDTTLDKDSNGNFSSMSMAVGILYHF